MAWAQTLHGAASAYLTVELPPDPLPAASDPRQVAGELFEGCGYHFYPSRRQVSQWLSTARFGIEDQSDEDEYWHLLLAR